MVKFGICSRYRHLAILVAIVTAGVVGVTPAAAAVAADLQSNAAPAVVPAVRSWHGGSGHFTLTARSRIVATGSQAAVEARTFAGDLSVIAGHPIPVVYDRKSRSGDVALTLAPDAAADPESYRLDVGETVTLTAPTATGLSRGAQTVEQMLQLDPRHAELPRGSAQDSPEVAQRGVMIDVARKYYQPAYIEQLIRTAAWYKLNTVHLHLSEYNAFRLNSPKFPGLAPTQSYDRDDIRAFEAVAARYHVEIIPEIDLPAHSTAIADYWPQTKWDCTSMGSGYTLDYTKQATRDVVKQLLEEFVPWFDGRQFHIGTDETPAQPAEDNCPELATYATAHGYGSTSDPLVEFIDYLNGIVRSHGKQTVMWGAWDVNQTPTIDPDKNIVVEAWNSSPQQYLDKGYQVISSPSDLLYATPGAPPGSTYVPNVQYLYSQWQPSTDPRLVGYFMSRWSDDAFTAPDAYLDWFAYRGQQVLADRAWGGPRQGSWLDFETRADLIGPPPGVPGPTPDAVKLGGTPYGSASLDPQHPASNVFDGDAATFFDAADANGAYAGTDLGAGKAATVTKIRFLPRSTQPARMIGGQFQGCTDGPTSGCTVLASVPWNPAAYDWRQLTVSDDPGRYRWLRYVAPDGGYGNVAEVEFYTAPATTVAVHLSAPPQLRARGANVVTTTLTNLTGRPLLDVTAGLAVNSVDSGTPLQVTALDRARVPALPPHQSVTVRWSVDVPLDVVAGTYRLVATVATQGDDPRVAGTDRSNASVLSDISATISAAVTPSPVVVEQGASAPATLTLTSTAATPLDVSWTATPADDITLSPRSGTAAVPAGGTTSVALTVTATPTAHGTTSTPIAVSADGVDLAGATLRVSVPFANLAQGFDNVGITDDSDVNPSGLAGGIDGDGSSLSQQALSAAGAAPGGTFTYGGVSFTWPSAAAGTPDNVIADGQNVLVGKSGHTLGLLVTATYVAPGTFSGTGTINYTDGTTQPFDVSVPEWQRGYTAPADEAITMSYHNYAPVGQVQASTHVFFVSANLDAAKTVGSITLPPAPGGRAGLHVFSLAVG